MKKIEMECEKKIEIECETLTKLEKELSGLLTVGRILMGKILTANLVESDKIKPVIFRNE